ncbi:MAG TPA: BON domain-containing protein [Anaerolineales bacterium]|nr:BON domain-containing protein [Anaerolineales bacterium]
MLLEKKKLAEQLYALLRNDPRTEDSLIDVIDENGIVTLMGEVDSENTKQAASEIVKGHPDVVAAFNKLVVARN